MTNSILNVLYYFSQFSYPPTTDEVYTYLNKKMSEREFKTELNQLISKGKVIKIGNRISTKNSDFQIYKERNINSELLLHKSLPLLKKLSYVPSILFIGVSGSLSMKNTSKEGDIDLFVITKQNAIWQSRMIVLVYKYMLHVVNKNIASKLCFNLFFSESGLLLPLSKHNEYIGHELLQLKPVINKNNIYEELLSQNNWITKLFPNIKLHTSNSKKIYLQQSIVSKLIEFFLFRIQTFWLKKNGYRWQYNNQQLWLIQEDFQNIVLHNNPKNMS